MTDQSVQSLRSFEGLLSNERSTVWRSAVAQCILTTTSKLTEHLELSGLLPSNDDKVSVIGTEDVGMSVAVCLVIQEVSSNVILIDPNVQKLEGQVEADIQQGFSFLPSKIRSSQDYGDTIGSKVCIITAGAKTSPEESRSDLVRKNTAFMRLIVPKIAKYSPETILLIVTNPVDIMTWVAWKISGFPKHRVIGSGTMLDSARFSYLVGEKLGVSTDSVEGLIIGEHSDSSVLVWSHLSVAGVRLRDINPKIAKPGDEEDWKSLQKKVIEAAYENNKFKGFKNWAAGICVADLVKAILKNTNKIFPVSAYIKGNCGIEHEVFLSLPAVIGKDGISSIVNLDLSCEEKCQLTFSAHKVLENISQLTNL